MEADAGGPIADLLAAARPEEAAIRSRWQHDAVPPWRRVEPTMVCEVRVTNLDLGRWARFPVGSVRWRLDRSVDDCGLDQLSSLLTEGHGFGSSPRQPTTALRPTISR